MTSTNTEGDAWAAFKREYGLHEWPTSERFAPKAATLAPLRAAVERLGPGRPRKCPPAPLPDGSRYCWACESALPLASFYADPRYADGVRSSCRRCEATARARRKRDRNARMKSQSINGGGVSATQ